MEYEYSSVDRIETPHSYMYTSYHGGDFLSAYIQDRRDKIDFNQDNSPDEIFAELSAMLEESAKGIAGDVDEGETVFVLGGILKDLIANENRDCVYRGLSAFIKRYEVTKKLYCSYDEDGKSRGSYISLEPYLYLSLACLVYFCKFGNLKMLNCALKLGDVLSSCRHKIEDMKLLKMCFELELSSVHKVMEKAAVKI